MARRKCSTIPISYLGIGLVHWYTWKGRKKQNHIYTEHIKRRKNNLS